MPKFISVKNSVLNTGVNNIHNFYLGIGAISRFNRSAFKTRAVYCCSNYTESVNEIIPDSSDIIVFAEGVPVNTSIELQIWYDSSESINFKPGNIYDDSNIQQWLDKSEYSHNLNGIGNTKPLFHSDPSLNNLSIIELFDYNDNSIIKNSYFSINPLEWFNNLSEFTYFIVFKPTLPSYNQILSTTNNNILYIRLDTDLSINISFGNATGKLDNITLNNNWHIITMNYNGNQTNNNDKLKIKYDKEYTTISYSENISSTTGINNTHFYLGKDTMGFVGYIAEILIYNISLNDTTINTMEQYISNKWNILV